MPFPPLELRQVDEIARAAIKDGEIITNEPRRVALRRDTQSGYYEWVTADRITIGGGVQIWLVWVWINSNQSAPGHHTNEIAKHVSDPQIVRDLFCKAGVIVDAIKDRTGLPGQFEIRTPDGRTI